MPNKYNIFFNLNFLCLEKTFGKYLKSFVLNGIKIRSKSMKKMYHLLNQTHHELLSADFIRMLKGEFPMNQGLLHDTKKNLQNYYRVLKPAHHELLQQNEVKNWNYHDFEISYFVFAVQTQLLELDSQFNQQELQANLHQILTQCTLDNIYLAYELKTVLLLLAVIRRLKKEIIAFSPHPREEKLAS
jgi:hypothetical protein